MDRAKSVLQKLKNKSRKSRISFQLLLQLFCQEEFLRRVSHSRYKESLILKGGLFLFTLTNFESRPTMDIDFLLRNQSNDEKKMFIMIQDIIDCDTENDFVNYEIKGLQPITEHKKYHGQRVKMIGVIDKTKTPFDIDFGLGDIVIPKPEVRQLNVQLEGFSKPEIFTYFLESTISEKWDAIIDRMQFNSRMKDFYDIYYLANHYDFDGRKLQEAIFETLNNRGRIYERDTVDKIKGLREDKEVLSRWNAFTRNTLEYVDYSEEMLNIFREKCKKQSVRLYCQDISKLNIDDRFDFIFIPFHSFSEIIDVEKRKQALEKVRCHLRENGKVLITLYNPLFRKLMADRKIHVLGQYELPDARTLIVLYTNHYDEKINKITGTQFYELYDNKNVLYETRELDIAFSLIDKAEITLMAEECGLKIQDIYGSYQMDEFSEDSNFMHILFSKK